MMKVHSRGENNNKFDAVWVGLVIGLVLPVIVFLLYWYAMFYPTHSLGKLFTTFSSSFVMKILSFCAAPDLVVFYLFSKKNYYEASKGMVLSIVILLLISLVTKFL